MNDLLQLVNAARGLDPEARVIPVRDKNSKELDKHGKPLFKRGSPLHHLLPRNDEGKRTTKIPIPRKRLAKLIEKGVNLLGYYPPSGVVILDLDYPSEKIDQLVRRVLGQSLLCAYQTPSGGYHYWARVYGSDIERLPRDWKLNGVLFGEIITPEKFYAAVHAPAVVTEAIERYREDKTIKGVPLDALSKIVDIDVPEEEAEAELPKPVLRDSVSDAEGDYVYDLPSSGEGDIRKRMEGYRLKLCEKMERTPEKTRNNKLFGRGRRLAQHAAHYRLGREFLDPLGDAALIAGLDRGEVPPTLDSAWSAGSKDPKPLDDRPLKVSRTIPPRASKTSSGETTTSTSTGKGATVTIEGFPLNGPQVTLENAGRNFDTLERVLDRIGFDLRYNIRARAEWKWATQDSSEWRALNGRVRDRLFAEIARLFKYQPKGGKATNKDGTSPLKFGQVLREQCLNAILYGREVDPFREWIESLPPWDEVHRLGLKRGTCWLTELFGAEDTRLTRWAARVLFIGAVWRTLKPGFQLRELPVFVGDQNLGKSAMLRSLLPQFDSRFFGDELALNDRLQAQVEATLGAVIVEVSEMAGGPRAEIETLKSYLTRTVDSVRLAYARDVEPRPRRFVFAGTANPGTPLPNDPSGNSRFVTVELPGFEGAVTGKPQAAMRVEDYFAERRDQLWAEALYRVRRGERPNLPRELALLQDEANEPYRSRDDLLEDQVAAILAGLDLDDPEDQYTTEQWAFQVRERRDRMRDSRVVHPTPLRRALQAAGLKTRQVRRGRTRVTVWVF